jgi:hypothetical protein
VTHQEVSQIQGAEGWSYGPFERPQDGGPLTVRMVRADEASAEFSVPEFVNDPEDLRQIALVVIGALEKWEAAEGLGA